MYWQGIIPLSRRGAQMMNRRRKMFKAAGSKTEGPVSNDTGPRNFNRNNILIA